MGGALAANTSGRTSGSTASAQKRAPRSVVPCRQEATTKVNRNGKGPQAMRSKAQVASDAKLRKKPSQQKKPPPISKRPAAASKAKRAASLLPAALTFPVQQPTRRKPAPPSLVVQQGSKRKASAKAESARNARAQERMQRLLDTNEDVEGLLRRRRVKPVTALMYSDSCAIFRQKHQLGLDAINTEVDVALDSELVFQYLQGGGCRRKLEFFFTACCGR